MFSVLRTLILSAIRSVSVFVLILILPIPLVSHTQALTISDVFHDSIKYDINYHMDYYRYVKSNMREKMNTMQWLPSVDLNLKLSASRILTEVYNYSEAIYDLIEKLELSKRGESWKQLIDNVAKVRKEIFDQQVANNIDTLGTYLVKYLDHFSVVLDKRKLRVMRDYHFDLFLREEANPFVFKEELERPKLEKEYNEIYYAMGDESVIKGNDLVVGSNPLQFRDAVDMQGTWQWAQNAYTTLQKASIAFWGDELRLGMKRLSRLTDKYLLQIPDDQIEDLDKTSSRFDEDMANLNDPTRQLGPRAKLLLNIRSIRNSIVNTRDFFVTTFRFLEDGSHRERAPLFAHKEDESDFVSDLKNALNALAEKIDILTLRYGVSIGYIIFDGGSSVVVQNLLNHAKKISYHQYTYAKNQAIIKALNLYLDLALLDTEIHLLMRGVRDMKSLLSIAIVRNRRDVVDSLELQDIKLQIIKMQTEILKKGLERQKLANKYYTLYTRKIDYKLEFPDLPRMIFDQDAINKNVHNYNPQVNMLRSEIGLRTLESYMDMSTGFPKVSVKFVWQGGYDLITKVHQTPTWQGFLNLSWDIPMDIGKKNNYRSKLFNTLRTKRMTKSVSDGLQLRSAVLLSKIKNNQAEMRILERTIAHVFDKNRLKLTQFQKNEVELKELLDTTVQYWESHVQLYKNRAKQISDMVLMWSMMGDLSVILKDVLNQDHIDIQVLKPTQTSPLVKFYQILPDTAPEAQKILDELMQVRDRDSIDRELLYPEIEEYNLDEYLDKYDLNLPMTTDKSLPPAPKDRKNPQVVVKQQDDYRWKTYKKQKYKRLRDDNRDYYPMN